VVLAPRGGLGCEAGCGQQGAPCPACEAPTISLLSRSSLGTDAVSDLKELLRSGFVAVVICLATLRTGAGGVHVRSP
jgi:hypothetical protein